jgi:hypothetical protein
MLGVIRVNDKVSGPGCAPSYSPRYLRVARHDDWPVIRLS